MSTNCNLIFALKYIAFALSVSAFCAECGEDSSVVTWKPDPRAVKTGLYITPRPEAKKARIPITVQEPSGVMRKRWPVRGGLPLFRGELKDDSKIRLLDACGNEVPVQGKATAYWPEKTVRFLCIDFLVDLKPNETQNLTLEYGTDVVIAPGSLSIQTGDGVVLIESGAASFAFKAGVDFLTVKTADRTCGPFSGKAVVAKSAAGAEPIDHALSVDKIEITERGAVQATVHLIGHYGIQKTAWTKEWTGKESLGKDEWRYPASIFMRIYANCTQTYLEHTFGYNGNEHVDFVQSYGLTIPTGMSKAKFLYGCENSGLAEQTQLGVRLNQFAHDQWALTGKAEKSGKRIAGWAAVVQDNRRILCALREAWQNWPVALSADLDGALCVEFLGEKAGRALDLRYQGEGDPPLRKVETHSMFYGSKLTLFYSGSEKGEMDGRAAGIAKIHELLLDFGSEAAADIGRAHQQPLYPWPGSKLYRTTRALGHIAVYDNPQWDFVREYFSTMFDAMPVIHEANGLYGFVDWGDVPMCNTPKDGKFKMEMDGGVGWSNAERGLAPYFYHYAATGERRFLDMGRAMVHHTIGIDMEHYGGDDSPSNYHRHNQVHWRHRSLNGTRQGGFRGWHNYFWLTGDPQVGLDALRYGIDAPGQRAILNLTGSDLKDIGYDFQACASHSLALWCWETSGEERLCRAFPGLVKLWKNCGEQRKVTKRGWIFFNIICGEPQGYKLAANGPLLGYWLTYGGDDLCVEWAALTGDPNAVDAILLQGKMHGTGTVADGVKYVFESPEHLYLGMAYLNPEHTELKRLLELRLWRHSGLKRFKEQNLKAPVSYKSAEDWHSFNTSLYGKNGISNSGAQCLEILYLIRAMEILDGKK